MNRQPRFRRFIAFALICLFLPFFAFGATVAATGTISVSVRQNDPDGTNLWIPLPAFLVDLGLMVAPALLPPEALEQARAQVKPVLPALLTIADELEEMPSGVVIEVWDHGEHMLVTKTWRSFEIEVINADENVRISVPARLFGSALRILA
jgi:hypothetical protein